MKVNEIIKIKEVSRNFDEKVFKLVAFPSN